MPLHYAYASLSLHRQASVCRCFFTFSLSPLSPIPLHPSMNKKNPSENENGGFWGCFLGCCYAVLGRWSRDGLVVDITLNNCALLHARVRTIRIARTYVRVFLFNVVYRTMITQNVDFWNDLLTKICVCTSFLVPLHAFYREN